MNLIPYDSNLWTQYRGAYGNVCEEVKMVMGDEKEDYEIAYDNIWANLLHQMTFYEATYIVIPYIVKLLEKNERDFNRAFSIISNVGACLATDIPYFTKEINKDFLSSYDSVYNNYEKAVCILQKKTKDFIRNYFHEIKAMESFEKWMFAILVMAILGNREAAYALYMTDWEEGNICIKCDKCGYYDESNYFDDENFLTSITPASDVQWDGIKDPAGINYGNMYAWFSDFLRDLEVEEAKMVPYLYGTYTCPECGEKKAVIDFMKSS